MRRLAGFAFPFAAAASVYVFLAPAAALVCAAVGVVASVAAVLIRSPQRKRVAVAASGLLIGALWCFFYANVINAGSVLLNGADTQIAAVVKTYPEQHKYGVSLNAAANADGHTVRVELYIPDGSAVYSGGDEFIRLSGARELRPGDELTLNARFTYERGRLSARAYGAVTLTGHADSLLYLPQKAAKLMLSAINNAFSPETAPFMRAVTLGDSGELENDTRTYNALGRSGIAHVVSVSGMHVAFLISFVGAVVKNKRALAFAGIPVIFVFCAVVGFSPTVTRAAFMQTLVLVAPLFKRRHDGVTSISAALLVLVAFDPFSVAGAGLQFSFLSTLGIVLFAGRMSDALLPAFGRLKIAENRFAQRAVRYVVASFTVTVAALAFTTPLLVYYFGYVSLIAPVTNLVTLWASSFAFCGGLISGIAGMIAPVVGSTVAAVAGLPVQFVYFAARILANLPFAVVYVANPYILIWLAYVYCAVVAACVTRGRRLRAAAYAVCGAACMFCVMLLVSSFGVRAGLSVTALNVGQGQNLAVSNNGLHAIIDCGGSSKAADATESYMQSQGAVAVDMLILTHFHADHANGVPELFGRYTIRTLVVPEPALGGTTALSDEIIELAIKHKTSIIYVTEPMEFSFGASVITVLPPAFDIPGDENSACIAILVTSGEWDALVTGDMDFYGELALTDMYVLPDIELLVAGHHGSKYATSDELLDAVTPENAFISVGKNSFGHPSDDALARLEAHGVTVQRTDESGNITLWAD